MIIKTCVGLDLRHLKCCLPSLFCLWFPEARLRGRLLRLGSAGAVASATERRNWCPAGAEPVGPRARRPAHRQRGEEPLPGAPAGAAQGAGRPARQRPSAGLHHRRDREAWGVHPEWAARRARWIWALIRANRLKIKVQLHLTEDHSNNLANLFWNILHKCGEKSQICSKTRCREEFKKCNCITVNFPQL